MKSGTCFDLPWLRELLFILLVAGPLRLGAEEGHTFTSAPFMFQIGAPSTWRLLPASFPTEEYELHHKDLFSLVSEREVLPILRMVKPADKGTISPAVQIFVEPAGGQTPVDFLATASKSAAAGFREFKIIREAAGTTLNGTKAARIETGFITDYPGGRHFPTLSQMWAIPRDKMMIVIAVTGQPDDMRALAGDIDMILGSIKFLDEKDTAAAPVAAKGQPALKRLEAAVRICTDLHVLDEALNAWALQTSALPGAHPAFADLKKYLDPASTLFQTGNDALGFSYGPFTVGSVPKVNAGAFDALSDVADQRFWGVYK